ncbi:MAG: TlpA disulfide reductase family protein [Spirochaetota bacterium]
MIRSAMYALIFTVLAAPAVPAGGSSETSAAESGDAVQATSEAEAPEETAEEAESEAVAQSGGEAEEEAGNATEESLALLADIGLQTSGDPAEAEDFELKQLSSENTRTLSSYEGNVVLLNFWASWCPPCIEEMPSMQTLYEELNGENFEIVAVNLQEDPSTVEGFIEEHGFSFPVLLDRSGGTGRTFGVRGIPTSYIIGRDGRVLARKVGYHEWDGEDTVEAFRRMSRMNR